MTTSNLINTNKLQPLMVELFTFGQPVLSSSELVLFAVRVTLVRF